MRWPPPILQDNQVPAPLEPWLYLSTSPHVLSFSIANIHVLNMQNFRRV